MKYILIILFLLMLVSCDENWAYHHDYYFYSRTTNNSIERLTGIYNLTDNQYEKFIKQMNISNYIILKR